MRDWFNFLAPVALFCIIAVALYAWIIAAISMIQLPSHKQPEIPWRDIPIWGNRNNIIFFPRHLTDKGKKIRRRLIVHTFIFIAAIMIPFTILSVAALLGFKP